MNFAVILTGGVGVRMKSSGLPKQFLKLMGKPIIIYTLEKFELCENIDEIIVVAHKNYIDYTRSLVESYALKKVKHIVPGGTDRTGSILSGLSVVEENGNLEDVVVIHDGVRPLIDIETININISTARLNGNAMTVRAVNETVVVSNGATVIFDDFLKRDDTYSLTSPQSFVCGELLMAYKEFNNLNKDGKIPILDPSMLYSFIGKDVYLVKESGFNLKVTTAADFYYLRAILELEENKYIFGL